MAANLGRLSDAALEAARQRARLLLCPEMFLSGYSIGPAAARRLAEPQDGPSAKAVAEIAVRSGLAIPYGYLELVLSTSVFNAVQRGADLIAVPTANMTPYEVVATTIVPARAFENQVYVVYANYCGNEGPIQYCGLSSIAAPDGVVVTRARLTEAVIVGDLERELMKASRTINTYLADRRPELYRH